MWLPPVVHPAGVELRVDPGAAGLEQTLHKERQVGVLACPRDGREETVWVGLGMGEEGVR